MSIKPVLWIEDNAYTENTHLAAPVYLSGEYDLTIALDATEGLERLRTGAFEAIVVDIRIPPGDDERFWRPYYQLNLDNKAARLGLRLLELILSNCDANTDEFPAEARDKSRYGVLSVEGGTEFRAALAKLGVAIYRDRASGRDPELLLKMIQDIIASRVEQV
jgi:hypothetical protein